MRLHVYLAKAGVASRRAAEQLIREGRVTVNGRVITVMGCQVRETDIVTCNGHHVSPLKHLVYLAVHKPARVICSQADEKNRTTVMDFIPLKLHPGLFHVGRLDYMSSGLIFYTNDGVFARNVSHPSSEIEKEYLLETYNKVPPRMLEEYRQGINMNGELLKIVDFSLDRDCRVRLTLIQGKNREIRRVCVAFGVKIKRLERVRIGCVTLAGIPEGKFRHLSGKEISWFGARLRGSSGLQ